MHHVHLSAFLISRGVSKLPLVQKGGVVLIDQHLTTVLLKSNLNIKSDFTTKDEYGFSKQAATLRKKWSFLLSISLVNVTKSADSCGFGHIYWRNT